MIKLKKIRDCVKNIDFFWIKIILAFIGVPFLQEQILIFHHIY